MKGSLMSNMQTFGLTGLDGTNPLAATIVDVLKDPSTSHWLKSALGDALSRDPIDAANEAEFLATVLKMRSDALLEAHGGMGRSAGTA